MESQNKFTAFHRILHWVMALAMPVLFFTGFLRMYWMNKKKYAETTLGEIYFLKVSPYTFILEMVEKVKAEATELLNAISWLMKNPRIAYEHVLNVSKLETKVDRIYRNAIKVLFEDKDKLADDLQRTLKLREVYRHISNMSDRADALGMAIIKLS